MKTKIRWTSIVGFAALLGACDDSKCDPSKESCGDPVSPSVGAVSNFSLNLTNASNSVGAILFEVTSAERIAIELTATARLSQVSSRDGEEKTWRVLMIGGPQAGMIGKISAKGSGVPVPVVTVVEVAANESAQYASMASSAVRITAARTN